MFLPRFIAILCFLMCLYAPTVQAEPQLTLISSETTQTLPSAQPGWPTPSDPGMVFFLQRSISKNVVVYAAQFEDDGSLKRRPIDAFWRRYSDDGPGRGQIKDLRFFESRLAYGVYTYPSGRAGEFDLRFAALPDLPLTLRQERHNQASLWARLDEEDYRLVYGYVEIDQKALIPRVERLRLYTIDVKTGSYVTHILSVTGGAIPE